MPDETPQGGNENPANQQSGSSNVDPVIKDPKALLNAFERQKTENAALKQSLDSLTEKLATIEGTLGNLDQTTALQIKKQIDDAEKAKEQQQKFIEDVTAKTRIDLENKYKPQIDQLSQANTLYSHQLKSLLEQQALNESLATNNGSDYVSFASLIHGRLRVEYTELEDPTSPTGKRMKLHRFLNQDGTPIIDDGGRELGLVEVFKAINQGKYGAPLKACFHEFNQSNGDGYYQGSNNGSDIVNPFSEKHWNLTKQGELYTNNPTLAKQMAAQAGRTIWVKYSLPMT